MNARTRKTSSAARKSAARPSATIRYIGFTLVELLTVLVIISLLMGILMPTFNAIVRNTYVGKTSDRIRTLDSACQATRTNATEGNYGRYPGQSNLDADGRFKQLTRNNFPRFDSDTLKRYDTGSQYLSATLFPDPNGFAAAPTGMQHTHLEYYVKMTRDILDCPNMNWNTFNSNNVLVTSKPDSILDLFPKPKPILYFVSKPTKRGLDQFPLFQNVASDDKTPPCYPTLDQDANYRSFITNSGLTNAGETNSANIQPYRAGEYLIIGAGISRTWFVPDEQINNFNRN